MDGARNRRNSRRYWAWAGYVSVLLASGFAATGQADAHWFGPGGFMRWLGALSGPGIHARGSCGCVPGGYATYPPARSVVVEELPISETP